MPGVSENPEDLSCAQQRKLLQSIYSTSYTELRNLANAAAAQAADQSCFEEAEIRREAEMVPVHSQQEASTKELESTAEELNALKPVLAMVRKQSKALDEYIAITLQGECQDSATLADVLPSVAEQIRDLEDCSADGTSKFRLMVPEA